MFYYILKAFFVTSHLYLLISVPVVLVWALSMNFEFGLKNCLWSNEFNYYGLMCFKGYGGFKLTLCFWNTSTNDSGIRATHTIRTVIDNTANVRWPPVKHLNCPSTNQRCKCKFKQPKCSNQLSILGQTDANKGVFTHKLIGVINRNIHTVESRQGWVYNVHVLKYDNKQHKIPGFGEASLVKTIPMYITQNATMFCITGFQ